MKQLSTPLADRELRYDGVSIVAPELVPALLLEGVPLSALRVTRETRDVRQHNANCDDKVTITFDEPVSLDLTWNLPAAYLNLTMQDISELLHAEVARDELETERRQRLDAELKAFEASGGLPVLQTICYVIDTFREKGQLWGVGRGSSCASYVLFLMGLHCVDPVRWRIPIEEFLHD